MKAYQKRTILLHLAATLLISCGFVKISESLDPLRTAASAPMEAGDLDDGQGNGGLPCGNNR